MAETYRSPQSAWIEAKLEGFDELARDLRRLPKDLRKKVYRPALRSAGLFLSSEIRKTLPKRPGGGILRKRKSIAVSVRINQKEHAANMGFHAQMRHGFYGTFLEYGFAPIPKTGHPGLPSRGYMRKALDEHQDAIVKRYYDAVRKFIDKLPWDQRRHYGVVRGDNPDLGEEGIMSFGEDSGMQFMDLDVGNLMSFGD